MNEKLNDILDVNYDFAMRHLLAKKGKEAFRILVQIANQPKSEK